MYLSTEIGISIKIESIEINRKFAKIYANYKIIQNHDFGIMHKYCRKMSFSEIYQLYEIICLFIKK